MHMGSAFRDSDTEMHSYQVMETPTKGKGIFACAVFEEGDLVLQERPLLLAVYDPYSPHSANVCGGFSSLPIRQQGHYLQLHCRSRFKRGEGRILQIFKDNAFSIGSSEQKRRLGGVFWHASRINHACFPNARVELTQGHTIRVIARETIDCGEEVTINYGRTLRFGCKCTLCMNTESLGKRILRCVMGCCAAQTHRPAHKTAVKGTDTRSL
ncbi:hypothetical protein Purlil1_13304 [Purpureocillium lilacinum]|uniref:SET domain-containing protein n=1 Tax=Purpureocillium lilacinum TaxID=33203 RepID=A0ABR0BEI5_PURLI|nr:hypothetical protein Purlil1_13304 [Purpureocillium lilacinum]